MQTPLIRVVLEDKSFFSNHVHPARQMLNVIAETGFHWLDETDRNDALHGEISNIVTNTVKDFDGDNQKLFVAYEQTNHLLQTLIKKAEAAERRQIDAARGKERLSVARQHASESISEVMKSHNLSPFISSLLGQAWTDVMALTELRDGKDSATWFELKVIAERIIASHESEIGKPDEAEAKILIEKIGSALTLVGYHDEEASNIAESLFAIESTDLPRPTMSVLEKIRFGEHTQSANSSAFELDENQEAWVDQIKELPIGTWFEFIIVDSKSPVRRKLAWQSPITHIALFVNQRGQKTGEMMIEELAIELSEGRARIQSKDKHNIIERAFENVLNSLRNFLPGLIG